MTADDIVALLHTVSMWLPTDTGLFYALSSEYPTLPLSNEALSLVHPDLPKLVKACGDIGGYSAYDPRYGVGLRLQLPLLRDGVNIPYQDHTARVLEWYDLSWQPGQPSILVDAKLLTLHTRDGVQSAYGMTDTVTRVPATWLDTHYSGWQDRIQIAQALGLPAEETAQQVFRTALVATSSVQLPMLENDTLL